MLAQTSRWTPGSASSGESDLGVADCVSTVAARFRWRGMSVGVDEFVDPDCLDDPVFSMCVRVEFCWIKRGCDARRELPDA
jgi:hypothetical protein